MLSKGIILKSMCDATDVLEKVEAEKTALISEYKEEVKKINSFNAKVLLVGGFSAGKTSLLNSLLGNVILPEDIKPETALATELIYGTEEKVIRVYDSYSEEVGLDEILDMDVDNCLKYVYVLNNVNLKKLTDITIVDMPGFDSGIEAHNKALLQYIGEAAAYIFVIDAGKGTIDNSSLEFLREIHNYSNQFKFILTKCDKMTPSDIQAVENEIKTIIEAELGEKVSIISTSSRFEDAGDIMMEQFQSFDKDKLLTEKYRPEVIRLLQKGLTRLELKMKSLDFNPFEIDQKIQKSRQKQEKITRKYKEQKLHLKTAFQEDKTQKILQDVADALLNRITYLVTSVQTNSEAFSEAVNSIIRPILIKSTQKQINDGYEEFFDVLQIEETQRIDTAKVSDKLHASLEAAEKIAELGKKFAKARKYKTMYKAFSTGLALTTSVVAPWLEFIIIFLPEIMELLGKLFGQSAEEKIRERIRQIVIPEICEKLRPKVEETLAEIADDMLEEVENSYNEAIQMEINVLSELKQEKEGKRLQIEEQRNKLLAGINCFNNILNNLVEE